MELGGLDLPELPTTSARIPAAIPFWVGSQGGVDLIRLQGGGPPDDKSFGLIEGEVILDTQEESALKENVESESED